MQETTIEEIMQKAREFQEQGKKWHFHMLTPDCVFNDHKDKHALVLEDETGSQTYVTYSDKRYMEQGQVLVKMIHGDRVLSDEPSDESMEGQEEGNTEGMQEMLDKARKLNEQGIRWHHHVFFPDCVFNRHKGNWCIVFEDKETNKIIESVSESEPKENLRKIEVLFYSQKE